MQRVPPTDTEAKIMSMGLRALMRAAESEPLSFDVHLYCGQMYITGRVAPSSWWYDVNTSGLRAEIWETLGKSRQTRREEVRKAALEEQAAPITRDFTRVGRAEEDDEPDELTLVDATILPALSGDGTPGRQTQPIVRVPIHAVDTWWLVSGKNIQGSGAGISWGFLFPIPD